MSKQARIELLGHRLNSLVNPPLRVVAAIRAEIRALQAA